MHKKIGSVLALYQIIAYRKDREMIGECYIGREGTDMGKESL